MQCSLLQLNLASNPLGGVLPGALPWDAESLATDGAPTLRFLNLGNCGLTGQLPSSWSNLTHLEKLEILILRGWVNVIARFLQPLLSTYKLRSNCDPLPFQKQPGREYPNLLDCF